MLECVVNISEGRDLRRVRQLADGLSQLLDIHSDADHNRSVFTLVGTEDVRRLSSAAIESLDIRHHAGEHPRLGVIDVVPVVALGKAPGDEALAARNDYARWIVATHDVPVFLYGPERNLPDVRRGAWSTISPDLGPGEPHPTAGAVCVGVREPLIAYNVALESSDMDVARAIAREIRRPGLRTLAFFVGGKAQISMNIVDAENVTVADAFDAVKHAAARRGIDSGAAELVGLVTEHHLRMNDETRWEELDLGIDKTIEFRSAKL
ncbi:MAG: hypothetical protein RJB08_1040 [Actinomycetota bacterium]